MDLEKITKFAETYGRDYILMVLGILVGARSAYVSATSTEISTEPQRSPLDGRLLSYAVISILAGMLIYAAAIGQDLKLSDISVPSIVLMLSLWVVIAGVMHGIARGFGSDREYLDTLAVCLCVMPTAFMLSALICFIGNLLVVPYFPSAKETLQTAASFLILQLLILAVYFPLAMRRVHQTDGSCQFAMAIVIVLMVGGINGLYVVKNEPDHTATARVIKAGKPVSITSGSRSEVR